MFGLNAFGRIGAVVRSAFAFSPFSPSNLFASGEQGAWYDPSDLTTMFQDSAGTTPVTADGQPVGLILDKSKGLVATATAIDGNMNTETWTKGTGWSSSGPRSISCDGTNGSVSDCSAIYTKPTGSYIKWTFNIVSISGELYVYASAGVNAFFTTSGSKTVFSDFVSSFNIFRANAGTTCTITDIKIEVIAGNHASQATDANRPLYKTSGGLHWLQFDGVDDSLSTAEIDFTSTDKMSVFSGILSASNTFSIISELGTNSVSVPGFALVRSYASNGDYSSYLNAGSFGFKRIANFSSPVTNVLSYLFDISQATANAEITNRVDGNVEPAVDSSGSAGSGNFPSAALSIATSGSGSYKFVGNIYSLIVRGALSTTQEITDTETWVNGKTGAY